MTLEQSDLERVVIRVSVGIGRNIEEAEEVLLRAKERKPESRRYNIEVYSGPGMPFPVEVQSDTVKSYLKLEQRLKIYGDDEGLKDLENLKHDPKTGLLNRVGYLVEVAKLRNKGLYRNRVIIFIDGDDMKKANSLLGYAGTDRYLEAMGSALKSQIRQIETPYNTTRNIDILLNRKNDSGGDEFIVDLSCDYSQAERIARRYVDAMYSAQLELGSSSVQMK